MSIVLGRFEFPKQGEGPIDAVLRCDKLIGQKSGSTRHYLSLLGSWSGSFTKWSFEHNRIPLHSLHAWTENRLPLQWNDIANGSCDSEVEASSHDVLSLMIATGTTVPFYAGWHHEPENEEDGKVSGDITGTCGTAAEAKAAGTRVLGIIKGIMGSRVRIGQTLMQGSYRSGKYVNWLPDNCEWIGVDGYSHGNPKETFASIFTAAHNAATLHRKHLVIQEVGAEEIAGTNFKPNFYADARSISKTWPECRIISWSNVKAKGDYTVNSEASSLTVQTTTLNAFKAWASDAYYKGSWT